MTDPGFLPTHVVPQSGLPSWETPGFSRPSLPLDPLLPVKLVEWHGDWAHIACANGWTTWVDGRYLVSVPRDPPGNGGPPGDTADPRPLLAHAEQGLARYRAAVADLMAGHIDGQAFRDLTQGLRIGVVVDGESTWLYDIEHGRWLYGDGRRLSTYATDSEKPDTPPAGHTPPGAAAPDGER
jgi:hypothetical protein